MSNRRIEVRIYDENISGYLEYVFSPPPIDEDDTSLIEHAICEVEHIRDKVGRWYDFTGDGDALLNSAHTIELELEHDMAPMHCTGGITLVAVTDVYVIREQDDPAEVLTA